MNCLLDFNALKSSRLLYQYWTKNYVKSLKSDWFDFLCFNESPCWTHLRSRSGALLDNHYSVFITSCYDFTLSCKQQFKWHVTFLESESVVDGYEVWFDLIASRLDQNFDRFWLYVSAKSTAERLLHRPLHMSILAIRREGQALLEQLCPASVLNFC